MDNLHASDNSSLRSNEQWMSELNQIKEFETIMNSQIQDINVKINETVRSIEEFTKDIEEAIFSSKMTGKQKLVSGVLVGAAMYAYENYKQEQAEKKKEHAIATLKAKKIESAKTYLPVINKIYPTINRVLANMDQVIRKSLDRKYTIDYANNVKVVDVIKQQLIGYRDTLNAKNTCSYLREVYGAWLNGKLDNDILKIELIQDTYVGMMSKMMGIDFTRVIDRVALIKRDDNLISGSELIVAIEPKCFSVGVKPMLMNDNWSQKITETMPINAQVREVISHNEAYTICQKCADNYSEPDPCSIGCYPAYILFCLLFFGGIGALIYWWSGGLGFGSFCLYVLLLFVAYIFLVEGVKSIAENSSVEKIREKAHAEALNEVEKIINA